MKNERQCGLAIPDVPCCNEHRLLALLAGDAVHRELGDVVTAVGVHFRELGKAGDGRSEALGTSLASFTSTVFLPADYDHRSLPKSAPKTPHHLDSKLPRHSHRPYSGVSQSVNYLSQKHLECY